MTDYSDYERAVFTECADAWLHEEIISLECAMTIASWWHSPASPNSTRLSTMGEVADDARLSDFASEAEFRTADPKHRMALESLDRFITDVQNTRKRYTPNLEKVEMVFDTSGPYRIMTNF